MPNKFDQILSGDSVVAEPPRRTNKFDQIITGDAPKRARAERLVQLLGAAGSAWLNPVGVGEAIKAAEGQPEGRLERLLRLAGAAAQTHMGGGAQNIEESARQMVSSVAADPADPTHQARETVADAALAGSMLLPVPQAVMLGSQLPKVGALLGGASSGAIIGGSGGALDAAIRGEDVGRGALSGAIGGGVLGGAIGGVTSSLEAVQGLIRAVPKSSGLAPIADLSAGVDLVQPMIPREAIRIGRREAVVRGREAAMQKIHAAIQPTAEAEATAARLGHTAAVQQLSTVETITPSAAKRALAAGEKVRLRYLYGEDAPEQILRAGRAAAGEWAAKQRQMTTLMRQNRDALLKARGSIAQVFDKGVRDTEALLRRGGKDAIGNTLADGLLRAEQLATRVTAERMAHPALAALERMGDEAAQVAEGLINQFDGLTSKQILQAIDGAPAPEPVKELLRGWYGEIAPAVAADVKAVQSRSVMTATTNTLNSLTPRLQNLVRRLVKEPALLKASKILKKDAGAYRIAQEIVAAKGEVLRREGGFVALKPFESLDGYFPHMGDPDKIAKALQSGTPERALWISHIQQSRGLDPAAAENFARSYAAGLKSLPMDVRAGNVQFSREGAFPKEFFVTDPRVVLPHYLREVSKRVAYADTFGGKDELFHAILSAGNRVGADTDSYMRAYRAAVNGPEALDRWQRITNTVSTFKYLGFRTALLQLTQLPNNIAMFGYKRALAGLIAEFSPLRGDISRMAQQAGATLPDMKNMFQGDQFSEAATRYLRMTGVIGMDRAMRVNSATAAGLMAQEGAEQLYRLGGIANGGRKAEKIARDLGFIGISEETVMAQGGVLRPEQILSAQAFGANRTQHAGHVLDLPPWAQTKWGRFFLKFKTFTLQQGKLAQRLVDRWRAGDPEPMIRYVTAMGLTSGAVWTALRQLAKDPKDVDTGELVKGMLMVSGIGVAGDAAIAASSGKPEAVGSLVFGPNVSLIEEAVVAPSQAVQQKSLKPLERWIPAGLRQIWYGAQNASQ